MAVARKVCGKCGKNRAEKFYVSARGRVCVTCQKRRTAKGSRAKRLMDNYGLTLKEYADMMQRQNDRCGICGGKRRHALDVDHDHALYGALIEQGVSPISAMRMSIRGLLCARCNRHLLPAVRDNVETLRAAIRYIDEPPALQVIPNERDIAWVH